GRVEPKRGGGAWPSWKLLVVERRYAVENSTAAYVIAHITVREPVKWAEYCSKVPAAVAPWGAEVVFRGHDAQVLAGEHGFTDTVVIRFPNRAAIDGWHGSAAYRSSVTPRILAADCGLVR